MRILGISAYYHDSASALVENGQIVAAAQEERFTRKKHDAGFPTHSLRYCLRAAGIDPANAFNQIDGVVFYDKPFLKFERLLETYLAVAPRGFASFFKAIPLWVSEKLFQKNLVLDELTAMCPGDWQQKLLFSEHHLSHAASAFYPSPFGHAAILTMDGVGEWTTTSISAGNGNKIELLKEINFPHSLGLLYSAFTYFTGFKVNSGEYKVMGLAPYGEPRFKQKILDNLVDLKDDGSFQLNTSYFDYIAGLRMTNERFADLFGVKTRTPEERLEQVHMDLAASVQAVTEEAVFRLAEKAKKDTGYDNLCLAGGVALNCVANGHLLRKGTFKQIWTQPAAGDAGGALGAALAAYYMAKKQPRIIGSQDMQGSYLGPSFTTAETEQRLKKAGAKFATLSDGDLMKTCAGALADGKALGWFQGRMEFGPRALGARSIIADARSPKMQSQLNLKVKFRESFRPFAPAVLREDLEDWFEIDCDSPYMLFVAPVVEGKRKQMTAEQEKLFGIEKLNVPRSEIPAVTHVDYSARIQTVHEETNPRFHSLLKEFKSITKCPVLVNTSFNVRGEPIVCTPEDAFRCFMGTDIDMLVVENCVLRKEDQDPALKQDYKEKFELD